MVFPYPLDYPSQARTLPPSYVTDEKGCVGDFSKSHSSGWTISGIVNSDWFFFVNDFKAFHEQLGEVYGNFEEQVTASSQQALSHFLAHHAPEEWDYRDI